MSKNFKIFSILVASLGMFSAYANECPAGPCHKCHDENTEWVCPEIPEGQDYVAVNCMPTFDPEAKLDPLCSRHPACAKLHCPGVEFVY